ncbi:MAG: hypothetical protein NTZ40_13825 [Cyanobacteria bacterium]|nr:hypothetical protein [Cyanobacteriota bacterium]
MITKHRQTLWIEGVEDRHSMNEEAILERPSLAESRRWLEEQVWTLPVLDQRSAEVILGFGDDGLCG